MLKHYILIGLSRINGVLTAQTGPLSYLATEKDIAKGIAVRTQPGSPKIDVYTCVDIKPADTFPQIGRTA